LADVEAHPRGAPPEPLPADVAEQVDAVVMEVEERGRGA
jgi:hypothetical protein